MSESSRIRRRGVMSMTVALSSQMLSAAAGGRWAEGREGPDDKLRSADFRGIARTLRLSRAKAQHMAGTAAASFDGLLELESTFYQAGYDGGFPHGEVHGLFEGRELGRDKSWELWEELGYYEGAAKLWQAILGSQGDGANPRFVLERDPDSHRTLLIRE